jgi:hypothetical protein
VSVEDGRCAEARSDLSSARQLVSSNSMRMLAHANAVYWLCGERARARAGLTEMKQRPDARDHGILVAVLHARFGEKDSAFVWLGRHERWMLPRSASVSAEPLWDSLRSDPRFPQLLEQQGLRPPRRN